MQYQLHIIPMMISNFFFEFVVGVEQDGYDLIGGMQQDFLVRSSYRE